MQNPGAATTQVSPAVVAFEADGHGSGAVNKAQLAVLLHALEGTRSGNLYFQDQVNCSLYLCARYWHSTRSAAA